MSPTPVKFRHNARNYRSVSGGHSHRVAARDPASNSVPHWGDGEWSSASQADDGLYHPGTDHSADNGQYHSNQDRTTEQGQTAQQEQQVQQQQAATQQQQAQSQRGQSSSGQSGAYGQSQQGSQAGTSGQSAGSQGQGQSSSGQTGAYGQSQQGSQAGTSGQSAGYQGQSSSGQAGTSGQSQQAQQAAAGAQSQQNAASNGQSQQAQSPANANTPNVAPAANQQSQEGQSSNNAAANMAALTAAQQQQAAAEAAAKNRQNNNDGYHDNPLNDPNSIDNQDDNDDDLDNTDVSNVPHRHNHDHNYDPTSTNSLPSSSPTAAAGGSGTQSWHTATAVLSVFFALAVVGGLIAAWIWRRKRQQKKAVPRAEKIQDAFQNGVSSTKKRASNIYASFLGTAAGTSAGALGAVRNSLRDPLPYMNRPARQNSRIGFAEPIHEVSSSGSSSHSRQCDRSDSVSDEKRHVNYSTPTLVVSPTEHNKAREHDTPTVRHVPSGRPELQRSNSMDARIGMATSPESEMDQAERAAENNPPTNNSTGNLSAPRPGQNLLAITSMVPSTTSIYRVEIGFTAKKVGQMDLREGQAVTIRQSFDDGWVSVSPFSVT